MRYSYAAVRAIGRTILDALCAARNMKPEIGLETISIGGGKIRGGHQSRGHGLS